MEILFTIGTTRSTEAEISDKGQGQLLKEWIGKKY